MEAQPTTFAPAINLSQWKNKEMSQGGWLNGGGSQWIDTNGDDSSIQSSNSDWGAKGPPKGLMDQKKTNGWPAISSSNGMKPGDFGNMNGGGGDPGSGGLGSSNQGLSASIWGSGSPAQWGGGVMGSDKSETVTSSFSPSLSSAPGTTIAPSSSSGSPWSQGSPITPGEGSNTSMSLTSASSSGGMTFTTSSNGSSTQWSGAGNQGPPRDGTPPVGNSQPKAETNTTSAAPSTTPTVTSPVDAPNMPGGDNKQAGNINNAQTSADQGNNNNMGGPNNNWHGGQRSGDSWNPQNSQGLQPKGGSGWGSVTPTSDGPTGWGDPPTSSAPGNGSGWGPTSGAPTGWGPSEKVNDQEALGTDIWGAKSGGTTAGGPSAWGKPPGALQGAPGNQWGSKPPNQPPSAGRGWGPLPGPPVGNQTGWGDPSADMPKAPPAWGNPGAQGLSGPPKGVMVSNGQWGKKPVNQGTKWEVESDKDGSHGMDTGTGVWNSQMQNPPPPPPNAWNKEPPKSPWGNPGQQHQQPQMKPPQSSDSAWGSSPAAPKAWGNPDESPKPPAAWGQQPPPQQWNQQHHNPQDGSRGGAWGAPPPTKPPTSDGSYGSWNRDEDAKKQQQQPPSFPQGGGGGPPQSGAGPAAPGSAGWMPMLDIPQEIVPTGWGQLSPTGANKPFGIDDGTYVWGDSKEHNAWVTEMSAKNVLRMKQLKQKAAAAAANSPGGSSSPSAMQSPTVPTSKPPSTPGSEDGSAPPSSGSFGGSGDPGTPTTSTAPSMNRPKSESAETSGEWQSLPRPPSEEGGNKWKTGDNNPTSSAPSTWNRSGSTQSMDSMQRWNEEPPTSSSIGHWGDDDWDKRSQASDNSGGTTVRRKPSVPINGNSNPSQIALKLRALTDKGYPREEAENMLKKHNMNFDTALQELRSHFGGSDPIKTNDMDLKFSAMSLHGNSGGAGDVPSNLSMMQNMRNKAMPNLGAVGGPGGFPGQNYQNQRMPPMQQKYPGPMNANNPMRGGSGGGGGGFSSMQQQQQQQLMQAVASLNLNINSPQQLLHALQQNPQLLAQIQSMQAQSSGNKPGWYPPNRGGGGSNQFMPPQNQPNPAMGGQSRPRPPYNRGMPGGDDLGGGNPANFLGGAGFGGDMGVSQPQQSRMEQFFNSKQQQHQQAQNRSMFGRPPGGGLSKPMRPDENSRSASPAASESQPNSADSAFSDSSAWPFSQPSIDDQSDGVPEFKPGVPWKPRTSDVTNDPDATPGSVNSFSSTLPIGKTPGRERERHGDLAGILTRPMRPNTQVWGNQGSNRRSQSTSGGWNYQDGGGYQRQQSFPGIGGMSSRSNRPGPPPGLENNPRNNNWSRGGGSGGNWGDSSGPWSGNDGMNVGSNWLMLRNLGNVDSSYLHVMCNQHGMVEQFNLNQSQGMALVAYKSREDAIKARQSLSSLGINVSFVNPNQIGSMIGGGSGGGGGGGKNPGSQWSTGQNKPGWDEGMSSNWNAASGSGGIAGGIGLSGMPGSLWAPTPAMGAGGGMDLGSGMGTGIGMSNWSGGDMPGSHNNFGGSFLPGDLLN